MFQELLQDAWGMSCTTPRKDFAALPNRRSVRLHDPGTLLQWCILPGIATARKLTGSSGR